MSTAKFDVVWRHDALGLRFTPNEKDLPVVCQVPSNANPSVLASPVAVGDVLVAFDLHLSTETGEPTMQLVETFDQLGTVLCRAKLPVTLRFQSREKETPLRVDESDIVHSYDFTWDAHTSLGVSLAMDPCSLYAVITMIDATKISPMFQALKPELGDVLVAISSTSDDGQATRLDEMRFEDMIRTLRQYPRPCRLSFARLAAETPSDLSGIEEEDTVVNLRKQLGRLKATPAACEDNSGDQVKSMSEPPFLKRQLQMPPLSRSKAGLRPARKLIPISNRQSFRIDKPVQSVLSSGEGRPHAGSASSIEGRPHRGSNADEKGFYTVLYSGGAVGLQLRDCWQDDTNLAKGDDKTNRTNGYTVAIRSVTDVKSAQGLELATADDLLMAIGSKDLQHISFENVRKELGMIQTPTQLLFKKRKRVVGNSAGSSLVDTLLLFLM
uniref:PDZ domain-containing protein n=1 Tax=Hyaloperonospora arabidopsidis (strain Emoy2) TaxID=559515 RepID=M4BGR3_HYAAE